MTVSNVIDMRGRPFDPSVLDAFIREAYTAYAPPQTALSPLANFMLLKALPQMNRELPMEGAPAIRLVKSARWLRRRNKPYAAYLRERERRTRELVAEWEQSLPFQTAELTAATHFLTNIVVEKLLSDNPDELFEVDFDSIRQMIVEANACPTS